MVKTVWFANLKQGWPILISNYLDLYLLKIYLQNALESIVVDAGATPNMDAPDNYQTTYDSKTQLSSFIL